MNRGHVVVIGDVMTDIVARLSGAIAWNADSHARISHHPGGAASNLALGLAARGVDAKLVARIGADDHAALTDRYRAAGIIPHLAADPDRATGTLISLVGPDGARSFLTDRGANDGLCAADMPPALANDCRHLHISGYALSAPGPRQAVSGFLKDALERRITVSFDPGTTATIKAVGREEILGLTAGVTLFCVNEDEFELMSSDTNGKSILSYYPVVIKKESAKGARLFAHNREAELHCPARTVTPVDTTGAGDAFLAAFLSRWLQEAPLQTCLESAVGAGTDAVMHPGAIKDQP